jgi:lycopene beta-cyclase
VHHRGRLLRHGLALHQRPLRQAAAQLKTHSGESDLLIVGAGCAGLSLAAHLAEGTAAGRVRLVDPRTEYRRDRTWCFFDVVPHRFSAAVTRRWKRWAVRQGGRQCLRSSPGVEYVHVDAERFYAVARERIAQGALELGTRVDSMRDEGDRVFVVTDRGPMSASRVYDARPPRFEGPVPHGEIRLLQHFRGAYVRTDAPVFDPDTATLMDFDVPQEHGISFMYALPFSRTEALVEATWLSECMQDARVYDETLTRWRRERLGLSSWEVLHEEQGVLPMSTERLASPKGARIQRIGLGGGAAKPSTGYAFLAIQRQTEALALGIARGHFDAPAPRGMRELAFDRVMLDWMVHHREGTPALLYSLFEKVDPRTLARFLSEVSSPAEELAVMRAVPPLSFTVSTLRGAAGALRGRWG